VENLGESSEPRAKQKGLHAGKYCHAMWPLDLDPRSISSNGSSGKYFQAPGHLISQLGMEVASVYFEPAAPAPAPTVVKRVRKRVLTAVELCVSGQHRA
jgi:hypothetical protein